MLRYTGSVPTISAVWRAAETWSGPGLRRDVFFFDSGPDRLYGSLYAAEPSRVPVGVVLCPSWGVEFTQYLTFCHRVAAGFAVKGMAALIFHPPGQGDSTGDVHTCTMNRLLEAARDAASEASKRVQDARWDFAGVRFGATVAALAACAGGETHGEGATLTLVQPILDPRAYFEELLRVARRSGSDRPDEDPMAFGYAVPRSVVESAKDVDVRQRLAQYHGRGAVVRCGSPKSDPPPAGFAIFDVGGTWRTRVGRRETANVISATASWVGESR
jgi:hypothetical protein